jgi:hypothetical protein
MNASGDASKSHVPAMATTRMTAAPAAHRSRRHTPTAAASAQTAEHQAGEDGDRSREEQHARVRQDDHAEAAVDAVYRGA